jgi:uncharacterized membrane protein
MSFAAPVPLWLALVAVVLAAAALLRAWQTSASLPPRRRAALIALRAVALLLVGFCLLRPVIVVPSARISNAVVPILVDASRSMRLADADGGASRFDAAKRLVQERLLPALDPSFTVEVLAMRDALSAQPLARVTPDAGASDLRGALADVNERYRGQQVAGIVLVSDGAETASETSAPPTSGGPPVFTVGVGAPRPPRDREVLAVAVGDTSLSDSVVDLTATVVGRGYGGAPVELRVLENGRAVHIRRVTPPDDGTPVTERFKVSPRQDAASVYQVELAADAGELTVDNNRYSVLFRPPGRRRRVLLVEGAPGFEHSFLKRAWLMDRGLEVDSIVRKGRNERGEMTYYVQATRARSPALATGYPLSREALFTYDTIVLANVEEDLLSREQFDLTIDFVAERGGGLLMLGARSLAPSGLMRTPLEELMPLEFSDRVGRASVGTTAGARLNRVALTAEGVRHPVMQLGPTPDEVRKQWDEMPSLGSTTALGAGKPGASVLAVTVGAGGVERPLVAVQRYGRGRSMVFAGEASWRWRMMLPSSNRTYETFWRQAGRWLSAPASDPVALSAPSVTVGGHGDATLDVRDASFRPVADASVVIKVTDPGGVAHELQAVPDAEVAGRFVATLPTDQPGLLRLDAEARRGSDLLGTAREWTLVGGVDTELADPRRNDDVLERIARETGGVRVNADAARSLRDRLVAAAAAASRPPVQRELWQTPWMLALIVGALCVEWGLRRRWGLR